MNKKLFFAAAMALMCANASAQQVKVYDTGRKWNQEFDALIQRQNTVSYTHLTLPTIRLL